MGANVPYLEIVRCSLERLFDVDANILAVGVKEECINHRLAVHLAAFLEDRGDDPVPIVDIEYDRVITRGRKQIHGRNIRPDIIAHMRTRHPEDNLFVIEAKKAYCSRGDKVKIKALVDGEFGYSRGYTVSYILDNPRHARIGEYSGDGNWQYFRFDKESAELSETS